MKRHKTGIAHQFPSTRELYKGYTNNKQRKFQTSCNLEKFGKNIVLWSLSTHIKIFWTRLSIPYRTGWYGRNIPYQPAIRYARPPYFVPEKIPAVPANFGQYQPVSGVPASTEKSFFFFFFFFKFCNFWIFVRTEW